MKSMKRSVGTIMEIDTVRWSWRMCSGSSIKCQLCNVMLEGIVLLVEQGTGRDDTQREIED
jgi:hypothetical protein